MTSSSSIFASSAAEVTLERVRQLVEQNLPEGLTLEYKESYSSGVVKSVAAMANSWGGLILVGVRDDAGDDRMVGVDEPTIVQIVNACHDSLEPPFVPEIIPVPLDETGDRLVLVVRVDHARAPRPVFLKDEAPIRLQGRNAVADRTRLGALFAEAGTTTAIGTRPVLQTPTLPTEQDGSPAADFMFRTGFWVPLGDRASWRPLPEPGVERLRGALNQSAVIRMLGRWASQLGGLNLFERRGHNRARRVRMESVTYGRDSTIHALQAVVELALPDAYGAPATAMNVQVDVIFRVNAMMAAAEWPDRNRWRLAVPDLCDTIEGLLEGLTDRTFVETLADIADVDPVLVPQPIGGYLMTGPSVEDLLWLDTVRPIPDAGASHGANLVADPALDLSNAKERQNQVDAWVEQIALDSGLQGMTSLLARIRAQPQ